VRGGLFTSGELFVSDEANNRVLKWNAVPSSSGTAANSAWGQPNLTTATNPGASYTTMPLPFILGFDSIANAFGVGSHTYERYMLIPKP
jgi:hypothetical protein